MGGVTLYYRGLMAPLVVSVLEEGAGSPTLYNDFSVHLFMYYVSREIGYKISQTANPEEDDYVCILGPRHESGKTDAYFYGCDAGDTVAINLMQVPGIMHLFGFTEGNIVFGVGEEPKIVLSPSPQQLFIPGDSISYSFHHYTLLPFVETVHQRETVVWGERWFLDVDWTFPVGAQYPFDVRREEIMLDDWPRDIAYTTQTSPILTPTSRNVRRSLISGKYVRLHKDAVRYAVRFEGTQNYMGGTP